MTTCEDKANSPACQPPSRPHHRSPRLPEIPEPENWYDDLDGNKLVFPKKDQAWGSSDDEDGLDFADQEDKTVTARPRRSPLRKFSPPPSIPPFPHLLKSVGETFPGSPTMSVFSIPSGGESATYSSLAHLPLRAGSASALAMLPPSPPAQRERRRLRKKSRPPDNNVFELLDRQQDVAPLPSPPQPSSPSPGPTDLPPSETSNSSRSSILSRIGSVKRWGVRKRFTSPGPSDTTEDVKAERDATPRASGFQPRSRSQTPSWFFRSSEPPDSTPGSPLASTTLELKHKRSLRHLRAFAVVDSPTKKGRLHGANLGERLHDSGLPATPGCFTPVVPAPSAPPKVDASPYCLTSSYPAPRLVWRAIDISFYIPL